MSVCLFVSISVIYQNMNYMIGYLHYVGIVYSQMFSNVKRTRHGPKCEPLVV